MRFVELFGGIGGFSLGIKKAKKEWGCVEYYEIDKYAVQTYNKNFGTCYEPTDITKVPEEQIPEHDILCAGFPCQSFSIAGKRMGFEDTRGTLFFEIARIAKRRKPQILFLENVKGLLSHDKGRTFATILATLDELGYNAEWQVLNSKHFGVPQNRERVFIIGHLRGKSSRQVFPIGKDGEEIDKKGIEIMGYLNENGWEKRHESIRRIYSANGISPSIPTGTGGGIMPKIAGSLTGGGHSGGLHSDMTAISVLTPNREEKRQEGRRFKGNGEEMFALTEQDIHGVMIQSHSPRCGNPKKGGTGLLESSEHCFTLDNSPHYVNKIRRLTPIECERLQGFPDNWTAGVSDTQRYKQLGNAVTVNVIEEIVRRIMGFDNARKSTKHKV